MNWTPKLMTLFVTSLLASLLPSLCMAQNQSSARTSHVVFESYTRSLSLYSNSVCDEILHLRMYSNGRVEYEKCGMRSLDTRETTYSVVRKEAKFQQSKISTFVRFIEESSFPKSQLRMQSEQKFVDSGYIITLIYYANGGARKLELLNYYPDSKVLPDWLHEILKKTLEFMPKNE